MGSQRGVILPKRVSAVTLSSMKNGVMGWLTTLSAKTAMTSGQEGDSLAMLLGRFSDV